MIVLILCPSPSLYSELQDARFRYNNGARQNRLQCHTALCILGQVQDSTSDCSVTVIAL